MASLSTTGHRFATLSNLDMQQCPKMFCNFVQKVLAKNTDGYYILKNLLEKTGIQFNPLFMSVKELQRYKKYCKQLEKNDIVKAESLIKMHFFDKVMDFMLENNCKLEQEIISWIDGREAEL